MTRLQRRTFLIGGLASAGATILTASSASAALYPFTLGVASGEPNADGFVLWTRLAPSPLNADGLGGMSSANVAVEWQVSTDQYFTTLAASGTFTATQAWGHSVHVELTGLLPGREYWYRFRAMGHISPVGRARTAPAVGTSPSMKMLFASCSHYEAGYFTAYRRMAEENPDLILHLGDYIYEGGAGSGVRTHQPSTEISTLATYRVRHALYKRDPDLQAAHAAAPWLVVWDDHEVENNYANLIRNDTSPAGDFTARRAAAYKAYYEHMPLRAAQAPSGANLQLYRRVRWGSLATFHMLDTRQYRDDQACGDGTKLCPAADDPARTLTGATQESWLLNGLGQKLGTWDLLGQQVFFAQKLAAADGSKSMDSWDGYTANRGRIQNGWDAQGNTSTVVLTGDVHRSWASNLMQNYGTQNRIIGTELVTTSITSGGDGNATDNGLSSLNPHVKFYKNLRGYVRTVTTPTQMTVDFRALDRVTVRDYPVKTIQSYVIQAGNPGLQTP
ncbi:alkaline phosphatase D [Actinokineospora alba]|uniref:Alkaline phosphatase D n=1 Tax=Actinokineospora alba TaxID=504798 RepID=A0A1H0KD57_9PSEU|nr:alkaline phosphatase D family protein [Actinokineospora alba]TDP67954.1 alkaline phosphatase D [Actinokineospora alba]SDH89578.1 alkaline phosphatase D [Actinokineospora alba]SDO53682.1 alkaline phosphatase D [Actinokineospora alba]